MLGTAGTRYIVIFNSPTHASGYSVPHIPAPEQSLSLAVWNCPFLGAKQYFLFPMDIIVSEVLYPTIGSIAIIRCLCSPLATHTGGVSLMVEGCPVPTILHVLDSTQVAVRPFDIYAVPTIPDKKALRHHCTSAL
jgi:hypothetical protein